MPSSASPERPRRADAQRNQQALLTAAAEVFSASGIGAPVREVAARAGVGVATIYRHFPTRADLVVAVYRHQVEACAEAGPALLRDHASPYAALTAWVAQFVEFLETKHGLAASMQSDDQAFAGLHAYFIERLVPVCDALLDAAASTGEIRDDVAGYELMFAVGNLCAGGSGDDAYDPRRVVELLLHGLRSNQP